ncbi:ECF RNA polymerase sigma factor SigE [mine drainage metagenome]|uniref:ECF RNA polymerase sigma factor SigE n=1 Tax=mine drainage metagenome TaxID=410659 RepID=A0A1J5SEH1_9ZZZZ
MAHPSACLPRPPGLLLAATGVGRESLAAHTIFKSLLSGIFGWLRPQICNFAAPGGVLGDNDDTPVHTEPAGLTSPPDFTDFMRRYQNMVFSTAARLVGNDTQAEDIAQEVFIKAYDHWDNLSTSPAAGGWLRTVATNLSLNHLQRYRKRWRFFSEFRRNDDDGDDAEPVEFAAPDTFFEDMNTSDRRAWVESALEQLPEHQRVPLVLFHFEDLPYDEIARRLGVSLAKVKTDILRGRAALAKTLSRGAGREQFA